MFEPRYFKKLGLEDICYKVAEGERLTISDGERLFACPDMNAIGSLAHQVRTRLHGNTAYYVVNRHINYSNICVNGCRFCAFSRKKGDPLSFELSEHEILDKICAERERSDRDTHRGRLPPRPCLFLFLRTWSARYAT